MARETRSTRQRTLFPMWAGDPPAKPVWKGLPPNAKERVEELLGRLIFQYWMTKRRPPRKEADDES